MSRNSEPTKSLEIMTFQEILLFLLFLDTFGKGWKIRRLEDWKVGMLEGSSNEGVLSLPRPAGPSDDDDEYDADGLKAGML